MTHILVLQVTVTLFDILCTCSEVPIVIILNFISALLLDRGPRDKRMDLQGLDLVYVSFVIGCVLEGSLRVVESSIVKIDVGSVELRQTVHLILIES